jgi:putative oxidoreductase
VISLQRLFSNFANGWPGWGLLAQRVLIAEILIYSVVTHLAKGDKSAVLPELIGAGLSILVLIGLWTPVVAGLTSLTEIWVLLYRTGDSWIPIIAATLSATLAMIGPGAWSVDARLFGRKHITPPPM